MFDEKYANQICKAVCKGLGKDHYKYIKILHAFALKIEREKKVDWKFVQKLLEWHKFYLLIKKEGDINLIKVMDMAFTK